MKLEDKVKVENKNKEIEIDQKINVYCHNCLSTQVYEFKEQIQDEIYYECSLCKHNVRLNLETYKHGNKNNKL